MSGYEIRTYDESFLEKQFEIGTIYSKKWLFFTQSNVDKLREIYSRDNFDPDTRLYCFKNGEMVGHIGASISTDKEKGIKRANTRLAFVVPGHENVISILYNRLEEILKEKGVSIITTVQSKLSDNYYDLAEKNGFIFSESLIGIFMGSTNSFKNYESELPITDFDWDSNYSCVVEKLKETYVNSSEESLKEYLELTLTTHKSISFRIVRDGENIVAYCRSRVSSTAGYAQIDLLLADSSDLRRTLISDAMKQCKLKGHEKVAVRLSLRDLSEVESMNDFISTGFEKITSEDRLIKEL